MTPVMSASLFELVHDAAGNLIALKGRTLLALIGITIGTAAVIAMLHVGHNARIAALLQFEAMGLDRLTIRSQQSGDRQAVIPTDIALSLPDQNIGIDSAAPIVRSGAIIRIGRSQIDADLIAASDRIYEIGHVTPAFGRLSSDLDTNAPFAVLGWDIAHQIETQSGQRVHIGENLLVNGQIVTVIGVLESSYQNHLLGLDFNRSVIIPLAAARRLAPDQQISFVVARLTPDVDEAVMALAVETYFREKSQISVVIQTAKQMIAGKEEQMRIYGFLLLGIGAVSMIVGGVGIMNVMLMSVIERRQEIGLRQAVGARRKDIRMMFLTEALILSALGSTTGTAIGFLIGWIFASWSGWDFTPAPLALPLGAGMALVVGLFFGGYPAVQAARLDPIVALRSQA